MSATVLKINELYIPIATSPLHEKQLYILIEKSKPRRRTHSEKSEKVRNANECCQAALVAHPSGGKRTTPSLPKAGKVCSSPAQRAGEEDPRWGSCII